MANNVGFACIVILIACAISEIYSIKNIRMRLYDIIQWWYAFKITVMLIWILKFTILKIVFYAGCHAR